jgi:hypothetical protein
MSNTTQLINNGGSAFPLHVPGDDITEYTQQGMTLRDYFAAQETLSDFDARESVISLSVAEALAGYPVPVRVVGCPEDALKWAAWNAKWRAALRYIRADAMIAARKEAL